MQKVRPTYAFDVEGHTVVVEEPEWECKREASKQTWEELHSNHTLGLLFGLFRGVALGEFIAIVATLLAQLYIVMPSSTIGFMTQFYYWAIRMFGAETMIIIWVLIGMLFSWGYDHTVYEGTA